MRNLLIASLVGAAFITVTGFLPLLNLANCCGVWIAGGGLMAAYAWVKLSGDRSHVPMCAAAGLGAGIAWGVITAAFALVLAALATPQLQSQLEQAVPAGGFTAESLRDFARDVIPPGQPREDMEDFFRRAGEDDDEARRLDELVDSANGWVDTLRAVGVFPVLALGQLLVLALMTVFVSVFSTMGGLAGGMILGEDPALPNENEPPPGEPASAGEPPAHALEGM